MILTTVQRKITEFVTIIEKRRNISKIYGPPGTGKTTYALTRAKAHSAIGDRPIYIAFTERTAGEATERGLHASTLHSLCSRLLGHSQDIAVAVQKYRPLSEDETYVDVIRYKVCSKFNIEYDPNDPSSLGFKIFSTWDAYVHRYFTKYNDEERLLDKYRREQGEFAANVVENYLKLKRGEFIPDFNDFIIDAYRNDWILAKKFREKYNVLIIDEAQDYTPLEWKVLETLIESCKSVYIIGDDDQAIYTFRGADPKKLIEYRCDLEITLSKSHRVPRTAYRLAQKILDSISDRARKTWRPADREGSIEILSLEDLPKLVRENKDILILARTRSLARRVTKLLGYDVQVLTIHASKGLEADTVIVVDGITNTIVQELETREDLDNELRVWYVAVTRTRNRLIIVPGEELGKHIEPILLKYLT